MTTLFATFSFAFLGSMHCVGMCGPIAALGSRSVPLYQLGRLFAYLALLFLARGFAVTATLLGDSSLYQWVSRVLLICSMILLVSQALRIKILIPKLPGMNRFIQYAKMSSGSSLFSLYLGLMTFFLPCAWILGIVLFQASLPSVWESLAGMVLFWLGTLPALSFGQSLMKSFSKSWVIVLFAGMTLWIGWTRTEPIPKAQQLQQLQCH